jgi:hypothetical protein
MYSGGGTAPMRLRDVWEWYLPMSPAHMRDLSLLALAPGSLLYAGMVISVLLGISLSVVVIRRIHARTF